MFAIIRARPGSIIWVSLLGTAAYAFLFVYLRGADLNWDLLNYHFYMGYAVLEGRLGRDLAAANLQTFFNPYWNVLAYKVNAELAFPWNAWALASIQLLSLPALAGLVRELERTFGLQPFSKQGMLALAICLMSPLWWSELGTSFFSSATSPFLLFALWLTVHGIALPSKKLGRALFVSAGLLCGLATGFKLTNAIFLAAMPFCLAPIATRGIIAKSFELCAFFLFGAILGFGLTAGWNFALWHEWDSPLYPLYNSIFQSPYFDLTNFRDLRWKFDSLAELLELIMGSWQPTQKTSEVPFSDGRIVTVLLLTATALVTGAWRLIMPSSLRREQQPNLVSASILWFASIAFGLWALLFAYQRYFIPLELVSGLVIWILVRRVFWSEAVIPVMILVIGFSAWAIHVPDWNHDRSLRGKGSGRFGLEIPSALAASPAIYLVSGVPNSYVLPFMHPGSRFLRTDFTPRVEVRLRAAIAAGEGLPVRMLTFDENAVELIDLARRLNISTPNESSWRCGRFRSAVHRFVSCEVASQDAHGRNPDPGLPVTIDFSAGRLLPPEIIWVRGLSAPEPWGRWSDAEDVVLSFARCLPKGELEVVIEGRAVGPTIGQEITVAIGDGVSQFSFGEHTSLATLSIANLAGCERELRFTVPRSSSPRELGLNDDRRKSGIGLVRLAISDEQSRAAQKPDANAGQSAETRDKSISR